MTLLGSPNVLALVLAGGVGQRLMPLTAHRAKPAVPFAGRYRLIDFALSNFINSGIYCIKVLVQYKSNSLNMHVTRNWQLSPMLGQFVETVPAQMRLGPKWYAGSADAVYQNLNLIDDLRPEIICVFGADHIYRMNIREMLEYHVETGAEVTVAAIPVPIEEAGQFGVIEVDRNWRMIGFAEKPTQPKSIPGDPTRVLASMGNYVFRAGTLVNEILRDAATESTHDFGRDIISAAYKRFRVQVYDFAENQVPGQEEKERGYWRDVGSLESYFQCSMDLLAVDPPFSLYNERWPIRAAYDTHPPAKFVFADVHNARVGHATDSLVCDGCIVSGSRIDRSVLFSASRVNSYADVQECLLFDHVNVSRRARLRRVIVDKGVNIPPDTVIGYDREADRRRFFVSETGLVVIPKGAIIEGPDSPARVPDFFHHPPDSE